MAPSKGRVNAALKAMEGIGISQVEARPVLMKLLKSCKNRWKPIEQDNYTTLANAIFEKRNSRALVLVKTRKHSNVRSDKKIYKSDGSVCSKEKETASLDDLMLDDQFESGYAAMEIPIQTILPDTEIPLQTVVPELEYEAPIQPVCQPNGAEPSMGLNEREELNLSSTELDRDVGTKGQEAASHDDQMVGRENSRDDQMVGWENNRNSDQLENGNVTMEIPLQITMPDNEFEASITSVCPPASIGITSKFRRPQVPCYDITNGHERFFIPLNDEGNLAKFPCFKYTENNYIYDKAHATILTSRIRDTDCSLVCSGDCTTAQCPCACATNCAYTSGGLVKEDILNTCITRHQSTQFSYCKNCPTERIKNPIMPKPCKGHIKMEFIKECWIRCGCAKKCGNRVVQRGITCELEVFYTSEGKGWGLRTKEDLDKGAFVCEYVGEVLTTMEYYKRRMESTNDDKLIYPVTLDADWATEESLEDEKTLWLDATHYSNVARFINHRCFDANLVDIPVEIETTGHHYYHLAFFATRKIKANEELHWDYGINFNDDDNPMYAFKCLCGSKNCRDRKHISKCTTSMPPSDALISDILPTSQIEIQSEDTTSLLSLTSAPSVLRRSARNQARKQNGSTHYWPRREYYAKGGAVKKKIKGAARALG